MILLVDAGNTRIKWRLVADDAVQAVLEEGALGHDGIDTIGRLRERHRGPLRVVGSNVAGTAVAKRITAALGVDAVEWLRPAPQACGVRNLYDYPEQLGADRWAALIGARHTHAQASLVVTAGTATTVDLLSADGDFLGGLILPGVDLMQQSLARGTAQLPLADGRYVPQPRRTVDAIRSGCLHAQAGAIERMFRQIAAEPGALCLLGGGAADSFAALLDIPLRRIDNLVLCGLAVVAGLHSANA